MWNCEKELLLTLSATVMPLTEEKERSGGRRSGGQRKRGGKEKWAGQDTVAHASDSHTQEAEAEGPLRLAWATE